jgi:hypothetical protein
LLHITDAQAENTIFLERALPSEKLLFRHLIAPTRLLKCEHAAGHRCHDRGFTGATHLQMSGSGGSVIDGT